MKILQVRKSFKKEFKRQIKFAIIAAVGFTIAFAWRDAVFTSVLNYVSKILDVAPSHFLTEIYTAITITVLGVIVILITSKIFKGE
jgi:hypothetical protein